jgi:hypothetical protein
MSKKKAKAAKKPAKPAAKKKVVKKASKKVSRLAMAPPPPAPPSASYKRTGAATIFVYKADDGSTRVRTSPQLLGCGPGSIEWTVVNLTSDPMPEVELTWPKGSPWGGAPIKIQNGNARHSLAGAKEGRFKYNVTCNGYTEDPEVEWPEI